MSAATQYAPQRATHPSHCWHRIENPGGPYETIIVCGRCDRYVYDAGAAAPCDVHECELC